MSHSILTRIGLPSAILACAAISASTQAVTIQHTAIVPMTDTDFSGISVLLPKFNPLLGSLTGVELGFSGDVLSDIRLENRSASAAPLTATSSATLTLSQPDLGLLSDQGSSVVHFNAMAYDTHTDFGGTSGASYAGVHASANASASVASAFFSHFIGVGNIADLTFSAEGLSQVIGPGRISSEIDTQAGANAWVNYTYAPQAAVPEPGAWALLGTLGLTGIPLWKRRRR